MRGLDDYPAEIEGFHQDIILSIKNNIAFQQSLIVLLVDFPANAMDCAHSTTINPPSTRHRHSTTSGTNGGVSVVESGDMSTIYKSGSFLCSRKGDFVRKKYYFLVSIIISHRKG